MVGKPEVIQNRGSGKLSLTSIFRWGLFLVTRIGIRVKIFGRTAASHNGTSTAE